MSPQLNSTVDRRRRLSVSRMRAAAVGAGLSLALAGTVVATAAGGTSHSSAAGSAVQRNLRSAERLELRIRRLESEGYQQASCTLTGIRLVNPNTHNSVTVGD